MMTYKTIFSGRLEFGSPKSYEKVLKMFQHRVENYYKSDILLKEEDIFVQESFSLNVPRFITQASDKSFKNTLNMLEFVAQYAVAGDLSIWQTDNGKILQHQLIEPNSDKTAVQSFLKGRELIEELGRETEAKEALSRAIEKFERHALAYERRGYVNYLLRNYDDALYDYSKSIDINPGNADPYLGRAFVKITRGEIDSAISDLEKAIKHSMPLQPIYWKSRRIKGELHLKKEDYQGAIFELKLFTRRHFAKSNPNYEWRKKAFFDYGKALLASGAFDEALEILDKALQMEAGKGEVSDEEIRQQRAIALQKA